jgi:hypothetical protein
VHRALLESDRAITQTNERTLIKQLGMWLGLLTFARNKPVLARDMDLKSLIQDAYTRGRMIAVLPFVEKVLAGCKDTKVGAVNVGDSVQFPEQLLCCTVYCCHFCVCSGAAGACVRLACAASHTQQSRCSQWQYKSVGPGALR